MFEKIESSQQGRTYVAKAETEQQIAVVGFHEFASAQLLLGAGAYAIVKLKKETYLVITFREERSDVTHEKYFKKGCRERHVPGTVSPLTRILQRRFGWGDVCATSSDVAEAVKRENATKLKSIMPQF